MMNAPQEYIDRMSAPDADDGKPMIDTANVLQIVDEISTDSSCYGEEKIEKYKTKYADFYSNFKVLLESSCEKEFDVEKLKFMLQYRDMIDKNDISKHDASVKVGEVLVNEYVKPRLQ